MGWFDGASEVSSHHHHHSSSHHGHEHRKSSSSGKHHRHSSPHGSGVFGLGDPKHNASRGSGIFGLGDAKHNSSRSSFFGWAAGGPRSSSYYKRSPRSGYMARMYSKLRRLLRDLLYYLKKHPMKVFMLVIMPLITGGALTGLLAKFGIRLPGGIEKMFGATRGGSEYGVGRGSGGSMQFERTKVEGPLGALGGLGSGIGSVVGGMGGIGGAVSLAKMFM
ncbi:hypothetical protein N431DRAFT_457919 [Stipitochalara longipes BDJ]|nr:hypothetical protein N431DRAFT_457919 [Stipitochalara longipes BDJ]